MPSIQDHDLSDARPTAWQAALHYLAVTLAANLAWETVQLPLYTIWTTASVRNQVFAVLHCAGGDLLIAASCLAVSWLVVGRGRWPRGRRAAVAGSTICLGLAYTIFSEWLNVRIRGSWEYSALMPVLPLGIFAVGLSPVVQWLAVPSLGFAWLNRRMTQ